MWHVLRSNVSIQPDLAISQQELRQGKPNRAKHCTLIQAEQNKVNAKICKAAVHSTHIDTCIASTARFSVICFLLECGESAIHETSSEREGERAKTVKYKLQDAADSNSEQQTTNV